MVDIIVVLSVVDLVRLFSADCSLVDGSNDVKTPFWSRRSVLTMRVEIPWSSSLNTLGPMRWQ